MKTYLTLLLALGGFTTHAMASTDQAWAEHDKRVASTCLEATTLKQARVASAPAEFEDRVGYTAVLIQGRYPQAHMKNQPGAELCLYQKQSRKAFVTPWDSVQGK
ncbi:hypothetical protein [Pseudomonas sp. CFBP 13710]|uniref:hypothetical protein n=1 Tax=Pseudomonas sp. CFBP 13710 TaxID=2775311 RepID=UPI001781276A|nr:hypothetical protein [Pseudomonas sp. CFBP 13710]MBD8730541.1 hypothetical protein [Pseudomonas sp. CFBP 13710]